MAVLIQRLISNPISLDELVLAYRHVKAELFPERSVPSRLALLTYEEDLVGNLGKLRSKINRRIGPYTAEWIDDEQFLGHILQHPKAVELELTGAGTADANEPHFYVTEAKARWEAVKNAQRPKATFRTVAVPSIDFQILSMLWIMKVGKLLDGKLLQACRANRLKRLEKIEGGKHDGAPVNRDGPHIFTPYHFAYRDWRGDGLNAIEAEVQLNRRVVAVTMDLVRYYHRIDPSVLDNPDFWIQTFGITLDSQQSHVNDLLSRALAAWAARSPEQTGLPVGLFASRIIANALLHSFDQAVCEELNPVFYARYVDDVLLVISPPEAIRTPKDIMRFIADHIAAVAAIRDDLTLTLNLPHVRNSELEFGATKQRIFDFRGASGQDLLDTIQNEIDKLSSEFRLMPDLSEEDGSVLKQAMVAGHDLELGADALRKADSLSIRRLGLAILLRNHELLERCISDPNEWEGIRMPFYKLVEEHVLTPERYCTYFQYLPRIFGLISANGDWAVGQRLLNKIAWVQAEIESVTQEKP